MTKDKSPHTKTAMRYKLALCVGLTIAPFAVAAQSVTDQVVQQLRAQGYSEIVVTRTWLGRLRFVSERGDFVRELVINPQTGEVLRDYLRSSDSDDGDNPRVIVPGSGASGGNGAATSGGGNRGNGDDDEDDEDDENDDEDDEDEEDDDDDEDDDDEDDEEDDDD